MRYSKQHNLCLYDMSMDDAKKVMAVSPFGLNYVGGKLWVPCDMEFMQIMAKLGYETTSPILHEYDWPHALIPGWMDMEHQRHMAAFMTLHPRCFNLSDMGTGKTLSTLWAEDYLKQKGFVQKTLVIAPLSTLHRVWEHEIFTHFLSRRRAVILYGDRKKRLQLLQDKDADFYIINHDGLGIGLNRTTAGLALGELAEIIRTRNDINSIIVDEGTAYKDSGNDRYKVLRRVTAEKPYVRWLTGTPTPQTPTDAYSQAKIVRKDYMENFVSFRERTMNKVTTFKWVPRPDGYRIAAEILQPAIRYDIEDCVDLPNVVTQTLDCGLFPAQVKAIDELKKTLITMVSGGKVTAINEAALRTKLIQIASGAVYGVEHEVHKVDFAPRLAVLKEVIEQSHHKILVFTSLTSVVDMLYSELHKQYSVERITGNVSPGKRNEIFRNFQDSETPRIIVAHPECMAHGLTLTAAATTIWYGPTDKAEVYQQANKRMDRPGQRNKMLIVRIAATSTEREIYKRLDNNSNMQGVMLDLIKGDK